MHLRNGRVMLQNPMFHPPVANVCDDQQQTCQEDRVTWTLISMCQEMDGSYGLLAAMPSDKLAPPAKQSSLLKPLVAMRGMIAACSFDNTMLRPSFTFNIKLGKSHILLCLMKHCNLDDFTRITTHLSVTSDDYACEGPCFLSVPAHV